MRGEIDCFPACTSIETYQLSSSEGVVVVGRSDIELMSYVEGNMYMYRKRRRPRTMQKFYQEKEVAKRKEEQEQVGYERRALGDYVYSQYWYG